MLILFISIFHSLLCSHVEHRVALRLLTMTSAWFTVTTTTCEPPELGAGWRRWHSGIHQEPFVNVPVTGSHAANL